MIRGLVSGLVKTTSGGSGTGFDTSLRPLKGAALQNREDSDFRTNATLREFYFRVPYIIVGDQFTLAPQINNWFKAGSGDSSITTDTTYSEMSLEHPNGTIKPITIGGVRSRTLSAGEGDVVYDDMAASNFGVGVFADGITVWIKGKGSVPAATNLVATAAYYGDLTGSQCSWYDSAATTVSSTDTAGVFTYTGTAPTVFTSGVHVMPKLLGRAVSVNTKAIGGVGDSITDATGDVITQGAFGRGYFFKSMRSAANVPLNPGFSMARGGVTISAFTNGNKWVANLKYVDALLVCVGTNDFNSAITLATFQSRFTAFLDQLNTYGFDETTIVVAELAQITYSANAYIDEAGQTVGQLADPLLGPRWDVGGVVEQANDWMESLVGTRIKSFSRFPATKGVVNPKKWFADGVDAHKATGDGIHPNSVGGEMRAVVMRPVIAAL